MVEELDVFWTEPVPADKILVPRRALILGVPRQHALKAHTDTLDVLHRTPSLLAEEVEADDAVRVYVGMNRNRPVGKLHEDDFGRLCKREPPGQRMCQLNTLIYPVTSGGQGHTNGIRRAEAKLQPVSLVLVERVVVQNFDVQEPFLEVLSRDQLNAWRQGIADLEARLSDRHTKHKGSCRKPSGALYPAS